MFKLRRPNDGVDGAHPRGKPDVRRLPVRWAIILLSTSIAAAIAYKAGGSVPALMVGVAVVTVLHQILD
jgi:hypothetical protein